MSMMCTRPRPSPTTTRPRCADHANALVVASKVRRASSAPVSRFQSRNVRLSDPESARRPSARVVTLVTRALAPRTDAVPRRSRDPRAAASGSSDPESARRPSVSAVTLVTAARAPRTGAAPRRCRGPRAAASDCTTPRGRAGRRPAPLRSSPRLRAPRTDAIPRRSRDPRAAVSGPDPESARRPSTSAVALVSRFRAARTGAVPRRSRCPRAAASSEDPESARRPSASAVTLLTEGGRGAGAARGRHAPAHSRAPRTGAVRLLAGDGGVKVGRIGIKVWRASPRRVCVRNSSKPGGVLRDEACEELWCEFHRVASERRSPQGQGGWDQIQRGIVCDNAA